MNHLAPIVLFVYNRPEHTRRTLKYLQNNLLAEESRLFIFSDAAKAPQDEVKVAETREVAGQAEGFKSIKLIYRDKHIGLAASLIQGITQIVNEYGKVIVFEDDLISSPYALKYYNQALDRYEREEQVMHIGGYMYPLKQADNLPETFFYRVASSWGWATWKRSWQHFNPDIDDLMAQFDKPKINAFSIDRSMNFWRQMLEFKQGRNNSWAIRWYATIFLRNGLTLNPAKSLIHNIGHDGTGVHSGMNKIYDVHVSKKPVTFFPDTIEENRDAYIKIRHFLKHRKGNILKRIIRYIRERI